VGSEPDIRRKMDILVEAANPEYFCQNFDQGMIPMTPVAFRRAIAANPFRRRAAI